MPEIRREMEALPPEAEFPASPCPSGGLSTGKQLGMHKGIWEGIVWSQAIGLRWLRW